MIRGAIEVAQRTRVVGWIYSGADALKGKTVLAFVGGRCVGAGEVDGFRQDLLDAKLGDGFCGFDFPVRLSDDESVGSLIVRLQFSDVALMQQSSRVVGSDDPATDTGEADLGAIPPASVSWLLDRGMLEQPEYDFLKAVHTIGAYERGLRMPKRGSAEPGYHRIDPEKLVQDLLGLLMMSEMRVTSTNVASVGDIDACCRPAAPILALWSQDRARISLDERSHLTGRNGPILLPEPPPGGIDYSFGPDRLLFVHRDCAFSARGPAPASGIVVFTAEPVEAALVEPLRKVRAA